jgi:hypothetical protein
VRQNLPPWLRALTAEPGSREADFDWGQWSVELFHTMRRSWTPYVMVTALAMSAFSCADRQFETEIAANHARENAKPHDPWALDKPAGDKQ